LANDRKEPFDVIGLATTWGLIDLKNNVASASARAGRRRPPMAAPANLIFSPFSLLFTAK
jgi:hypothetical protein